MKNLNYFYFVLIFLLASCLPQEKTSQCENGKTFSATQRKCIEEATAGQAKITNVTPSNSYTVSATDSSKTHTVTVNDPTGDGFSVQWMLISSNNSSDLLGSGLSLTFNHTSFTPGTYTLEVQVLNTSGTNVTDSRSWSVTIIDDEVPSISQVTPTPFSTSITSSPTVIQASLSNPDLIPNVNVDWLVNGTLIQTRSNFSTSTDTESFSFDPTSASGYFVGANIYTVQLVLKENGTGAIYNTATWTISNTIPGFAVPSISSTTVLAGLSATPPSGSFVTAIDKVNTPNSGFLFDVDTDGDLDPIDFCVQLDNANASADETVGLDGDGVFVDFLSNGIVIATSQFTAEETPICLGVLNAVFFQTLPVNIVAESQSLKAVIYDKYQGEAGRQKYKGFTELIAYDWPTRVRQKNTPPRIIITDTNPTNNDNTFLTNEILCGSKVTTTYSSCEITQGARNLTTPTTEIPFNISLSVDDDDYDATNAAEDDKFRVEYFLDGVLLDGNHPLSSSDCFFDFGEVTSVNDFTCTLQINPFDSDGPIDPTGLNYTITAKVTDLDSPYVVATSESNTLTWRLSTVNDFNSGVEINTFADSPALADTSSYVRRGGSNVNVEDGIGTSDNLSELDNIVFHISANDFERDSFTIRVDRCDDDPLPVLTDTTCTTTVPLITNFQYNSQDGNNPKIIPISHTINQDAVVGTDSKVVRYQITLTDQTTNSAPADATINDDPVSTVINVDLVVNNKNEDPIFDPSLFNPALPLVTPLIGFTGYPITIDPGNITDGTLTDGKEIKYQWLVSADLNGDGDFTNDSIDGKTGFRAIQGATSRVLIWSPGQEIDFTNQLGTQVQLKLCLGDDGLVDGTVDSKNPEGQDSCDVVASDIDSIDTSLVVEGGVSPWELTVFSNMTKGRSDESGAGNKSFNSNDHPKGELAVWIDPRSTDPLIKYMVYVNRSREIVVEKLVTSSNGSKSGSIQTGSAVAHTDIEFISFPHSTDANFANNIVTDLSIIGDTTNDALYISYMAPIGGIDHVHVRRINIAGGKTAFTHEGKLGFDKSYAGLLTAPNPQIQDNSGNINITQDASTNGLVEVEFTALLPNNITVSFNGFTLGTLANITTGTDFCTVGSPCSTTADTAASFADAINNSANAELQGITATHTSGTNVVTLEGMADGEFLELGLGAQALGQIYINTNLNKWVLPYINGSLATPNKNKVSLLNGDLNIRLTDSNASSTNLFGTSAADEIVNDVNINERIIIATKTEISGEISVFELDNFHNIVDGVSDLFTDPDIQDIKISISKESSEFNPAAFVVGTNQNSRLAYARIDSSGGDFDFTSTVVRADLDPTYALIENLSNYDIVAGGQEHQLLLGAVVDSDNNGTSDEVIVFQITGQTNPQIDCRFDTAATDKDLDSAKCMRLSPTSSTNAFDLVVSFGEVLEDVTLGTDGATANESTQDIAPFAFHVDDGGGVVNDDAQPILGVINVKSIGLSTDENENLGATSIIPYIR